jgi:hypothetical protein
LGRSGVQVKRISDLYHTSRFILFLTTRRKVVLVTGSGRGIGADIAMELASRGISMII